MTQLYVRVRLNGAVADQRLCSVRDEVWLGGMPDAAVAFPGPSIQVRRFGRRLQVQGRWLDPGRPMRFRRQLGAGSDESVELEVELEAVQPRRTTRDAPLPLPDLRVLVASAAVVLLGAWWEAVGTFIERHPQAVAALMGSDAPVVVAADVAPAPVTEEAPVRSARMDAAEAGQASDGAPEEPAPPSPGTTSYPVGFVP